MWPVRSRFSRRAGPEDYVLHWIGVGVLIAEQSKVENHEDNEECLFSNVTIGPYNQKCLIWMLDHCYTVFANLPLQLLPSTTTPFLPHGLEKENDL